MPFISNATLCNIFHQNSTNPIVTSIGFQFGYNFVTVMLHPKIRQTSSCNYLTRSTFRSSYTISSFINYVSYLCSANHSATFFASSP
ncbi:hypothetical protein FT638_06205 [Bacillus cereus]|nr:hypothetical protein [Bacillus cereus]